jgi:large subunit ribosomal protein L23
MALFAKKEEGKEKASKAVAKPSVKKATKKEGALTATKGANLTKTPGRILKNARITEKAAYMTMQSGYVFEVAPDATKNDIMKAIEALYGIKPRKVNIVNKKARHFVSRTRNRRGIKSGLKKAYVFLNKGEKIDIA